MILKQKKNCKLIFNHFKFYIQTDKFVIPFNTDFKRAEEYYNSFHITSDNLGLNYTRNGKYVIELYPEDLELILKSIEVFKKLVDTNYFFKTNYNELSYKSFELFMIYQYLDSIYITYKNKLTDNFEYQPQKIIQMQVYEEEEDFKA